MLQDLSLSFTNSDEISKNHKEFNKVTNGIVIVFLMSLNTVLPDTMLQNVYKNCRKLPKKITMCWDI